MRFSPHASSKAGQKGQSKISWQFKCVCLPQPSPRWTRDKIPPFVLLCKRKQCLTGCCETTGWSRCISSHTLKIRFVPSASAPLFPELKSLYLSYLQHCGALLLWRNVKCCCSEAARGLVYCWAEGPWVPPHCTLVLLQSFCCLMAWASSFPCPQNISWCVCGCTRWEKMWEDRSVLSIAGKSVQCRILIVCSQHVMRGWREGHNVMSEIFPSSSGNGWARSNFVTPHHAYTLKELDIPRLDLYKKPFIWTSVNRKPHVSNSSSVFFCVILWGFEK